jgi:hypothetical protein
VWLPELAAGTGKSSEEQGMINPTDKVKSVIKGIGIACAALTLLPTALSAKIVPCSAPDVTALNVCIASAPAYGVANADTLVVALTKGGSYSGQQIRILAKKNLWIIGDTSSAATDATRPRFKYQDTKHIYSGPSASLRADTTSAGSFFEYNGAFWVNHSDNIRIQGVLVDGGSDAATAAADRIFAFPVSYKDEVTAPIVTIRGNVGINIRLSRNVQIRYTSVTNTWYGIRVDGGNLGGAFAYPNPNDPIAEVAATLPTSRAGLYGSHLIERNRIYDNVFGTLMERDWDLASVFRNNLIWGNYLRHWESFPGYITGLKDADDLPRPAGDKDALCWSLVGGAFLMDDVALTPYRIHNNTFAKNATIFGSVYKSGTQHLFYNNLVEAPFKYHNATPDIQVNGDGYTQTERKTEMLQYFSEHQRANRIVPQDGVVAAGSRTSAMNLWNSTANFRLFRMRMIREPDNQTSFNWRGNTKGWSNDNSDKDSLAMTWVPDENGTATLQQISDTGGLVKYIRHNFWSGTWPDPMDGNATPGGCGSNGTACWSPPYVPKSVRPQLTDPNVFRDVSGFDIRWAYNLQLTNTTTPTSAGFLRPDPVASVKLKIPTGGWPTYEGTDTKPLGIGALTPTGAWMAPDKRLVLKDTLIEVVQGSMVRFRMNVSGEGISDADIKTLRVKSAKFYNDVPVSDTMYTEGPDPKKVKPYYVQRPGTVLSAKAWPIPYDFQAVDYNRAGYNLDDSLTKYKLRPDNVFLGQVSVPGKQLNNDSLYARAEVVLEATLNDGSVIYSNPGVFMFSRPRFQLNVKVTDEKGNDLPLDADGISRKVLAGQKLIVRIASKASNNLPVAFKGFANLQSGNAGELHGPDGVSLERKPKNAWVTLHPNDTIQPYFNKNDSVVDTIQALFSPSVGSLVYRAIFQATTGELLPYFIQGSSPALRVVPNKIYQATLDTIIYETDTTTPDPSRKGPNELRPTTDTTNVTEMPRKPLSKAHVVINLRDYFGNAANDSGKVARERGLAIRVTAPKGLNLFADGSGKTDSLFMIPDNGQIVLDGLYPTIGAGFYPLVSTIVDTSTAVGHVKATYPSDTTWIKVVSGGIELYWVDPANHEKVGDVLSAVGHPIYLKVAALSKTAVVTGYSADLAVTFPSNILVADSTTPGVRLTSVKVSGGLTPTLLVRALDSLRPIDTVLASSASSDDMPALLQVRPVYPNPVSATYFASCDRPDQIRITFDSALWFRSGSAPAKDSIRFVFNGNRLLPSASALAPSAVSQSGTDLTISLPSTGMGISDTNVVSIWNPLANRFVPRGIAKSIVHDSTAPVLLKTDVFQFNYKGSDGSIVPRDSIVAQFSAPIQTKFMIKGTPFPFAIQRDGAMAVVSKTNVMAKDIVVLDSAKALYAFAFDYQEGQIVPNDTLLVPSSASLFLGLNGLKASNGCVTPGTSIVGRLFPKDAWIVDRDGDGNGDSLFIVLREPLSQYPDSIRIRWGTAAETLTVTSAMLQAWNVRVTDGSGAGDTLIRIALPSPFGVAKGSYPASSLSWTHVRTAGPADTAYFNAGLVKVRIRDSIGPAAIHAELVYDQSNSGFDTLVVDLSEAILGIAKSDSANFGFLLKSGMFPEGSILISVSGNQARIVVPNTVAKPIVRGDSVRVKPGSQGGLVTDASVAKNAAGDLNPWVKIEADVRPPLRGWYLDTNGDGRVETALLRFVQNPRGECAQYGFHWPTMDSTRSPNLTAVCVLDASSKDSLLWRVSFKPFAFGITGSSVANKIALGEQLPTFGSTTYRFPMIDSVGPVLLDSSYLADNGNTQMYPDTLRITPSEAIVAAQVNPSTRARLIVQFRRGSKVVADSTVSILALNCPDVSNCFLVVSTSSKYRPVPGDYVRLSVADSVFDVTTSRNAPSKNNPFQVIHGSPRPPYISAYYDRDHDGRIDSVAMAFTVSPVPGSIIEVSDPSGLTDKVRQYVVTGNEGDVIGFGIEPWGENVTSVSGWTFARIIDNVSKDTAKFALSDSVPPVIVDPTIANTSVRDGSVPDTLRFKASELVNFDPSKGLSFSYKPKGSDSAIVITMDVVGLTFDSLTGTWVVLVKPLGDNHPVDGDSIRFAPGNGVTDLAGNGSGPEAKSTEVKETRPRILPPIAGVETPIVKIDDRPSGDPFVIVTANPGVAGNGRGKWSTVTPGGVSNQGDPIAGRALISFSSNMPSVMQFYIYDQMGTFVNSFRLELTKAFLNKAQKNKLGEALIGVTWNGTSQSGASVADGIYMIRLVIQRELTGYEANQGARSGAMENHVVKVGIHH